MPTLISRYYFTAAVAMLPEIRATKSPVLRPTDGLTHRYRLRCRLDGDPLFDRFTAGVRKLAIVGAVPGAVSGH